MRGALARADFDRWWAVVARTAVASLAMALLQTEAPTQESPRSDRSVPELIAALRSPAHARDAQIALRARGAEAALPLAEVLRNFELDSVTRGAATRVLMELGPQGVSAFDTLVECLRDPDIPSEVIDHAALALSRIGPFAGDGASRLPEGLATPKPPRA